MPRLKQVKPRHINVEKDQGEQQPQQQAQEFTDVAPAVTVAGGLVTPVNYVGPGDDTIGDQVPAKRPHREETHICEKCCGEFFSFSEFSEHKKNCPEHLPVFIMNGSEGLVPLEDFSGAVLSHQPQSSSSKDSHREDGGSSGAMEEKPGMQSVPYLKKKETTLPSLPQELSYIPKGNVTSTNVILHALPGTKVAVHQQRADTLPAPLRYANSIPSVVEQIFCLQKQQLQQIQLIEHVRKQVDPWAPNTLYSGMVGTGNLNTLDNRGPQPVSAAVASHSQKAGSQGLPLDTLKEAKLPYRNILPTTSSASPGLMYSASRPDGTRVLLGYLPGPMLPGTPGSVHFQSPLGTEQIRMQPGMWAPNTLYSGMVGTGNLNTLDNRGPQPVSAAVASHSQKAGSQGLPLDTLKEAKLPYTNILPTTSSASPGLMSSASRPDGSRVLLGYLPGPMLPGTPGSVHFQSPLGTEQIRMQPGMWVPNTLHSGMAGTGNLNTLDNRGPQPVSAAVASHSQKAGSQGLPLDTLKEAKLPYRNILPTTSSGSPGLMSSASRPDGSRVLPGYLPGPMLPGTPSSVRFQSPLGTAPVDLTKNGKEKPPIMLRLDSRPRNPVPFYRYVCKYCGKVFENDSSLQIHLFSHSRKSLFMCSFCGYLFTSEDGIREHFYQHLQVPANPQPFADFHNRMATGSGAHYAYPVPVPVNQPNISSDSRPVLVLGTPMVGLPQNVPLVSNPMDQNSGPLAKDLHPRPSPESEDGSIHSGLGPNHNPPRVEDFQGRGGPELESQTLKMQQLVKNIDKATTDPNDCPAYYHALSCQSSLRTHHHTHARERPFQCRICDRAFSTKGSLQTHLEAHQTNTSIKTHCSCPICQKKFTNAVMLQQHVRMHLAGQIPNMPLPESPRDLAGLERMVVSESGRASTVCPSDSRCIDVDKVSSQDAPSSSLKVPVPLSSTCLASPTPRFTHWDAPGKVSSAPVVLQEQSGRGMGSVKSGGLIKDLPSVMGDPQHQGQSPHVLGTTSFQGSQAESIKFKSPDAGGKTDRLENSPTEMGRLSGLPFDRAQPAYVNAGVSGAFGSPTMFPGMAPLLMAQPGQQGNQHGCMRYRENQSSASALQIHEQTHTGGKPFVCNTFSQAFTTRGNLQDHYMTHVADNSSAHRGRKLAIENTTDLLGTDGKMFPQDVSPRCSPKMFPQEIMAPSVSMRSVMGNEGTNMPNDDLAMKTNKIPVTKGVRVSTPSASLGASFLVGDTTVSKIESLTQTPVPSPTEGKEDSS